jgi:hypothetical protein
MWDGKVEAILESEKYDTLMVNEPFSKLKSAKEDHGVTARLESLTDSHSFALIGGLGAKSNANASSQMYSLSSLMYFQDEEFHVLVEDELALLTKRFERLHENRVNIRKTSRTFFQCGKPEHFIADCLGATWFWKQKVVCGACDLGYSIEFILLEESSPSRRTFIGSHSLPHPLVASSVLQLVSEPDQVFRDSNQSKIQIWCTKNGDWVLHTSMGRTTRCD